MNFHSFDNMIELSERNSSGSRCRSKSVPFFDKANESEDSDPDEASKLIYPYATLRCSKSSPAGVERQAATIAKNIQRNSSIMQDNPIAEQLRLQTIKNMSHNLTFKRSIKAKLKVSVEQTSRRRPIGFCTKYYYQSCMLISKLKTTLLQSCSGINLWDQSIKIIEGHFGSGISTYFKFLRWLFVMNLFSCVISVLFVILPQSLLLSYTNTSFSPKDFLLGNGFLTDSVMFYGFYTNDTVIVHSKVSFNIPMAYFVTFLLHYVLALILLCFKVARCYKECFIETSGGAYNRYANKIFCGLDWAVSTKKAADLQSESIYRELKELLWEAKVQSSSTLSIGSCSTVTLTYLIRITMTTLVGCVICGIGGVVWVLLNENHRVQGNVIDDPNGFRVLLVPVALTIVVHLVPQLISWSAKYEKYRKERTGFYLSIVRAYLVCAAGVGSLLAFWLTVAEERGRHSSEKPSWCWQTRLGQEIYRLVVLDLLASILLALSSAVVGKILKNRDCISRVSHFDFARHSLVLVYNQSLFWLGHCFSPGLSLIVLLKMFVTFYLRKWELLYLREPPNKFWKASNARTLFFGLTLLGLIGALGTIVYAIARLDVSGCGPFSGYPRVWRFVVERLLGVNEDSLCWDLLADLFSLKAGVTIFFVVCIAVYYFRAKAKASKQMVDILREMLVWQARDKEFLLKKFSSVVENSGTGSNLIRRVCHEGNSCNAASDRHPKRPNANDDVTVNLSIHEPSTSR